MSKKLIALLTVLCLLLTFTACAWEKPDETLGAASLNPTFAAMPQKTQDLAEVYSLSNKVALFAFITPGMDSSITELVAYDLSEDKLLGELNLGECYVGIFPQEDNFAIFDYNRKTYTLYDTACQQISTAQLTFEGAVGAAASDGDSLILSDMRTGRYYIYDLKSNTATPVDETVGAADFTCAGLYKDAFLLHNYSSGVIAVNKNGERESVNTVAASAQAVGNAYAAGILGDYAVFYSLAGGDAVMCHVRGEGENFSNAAGDGYLSRSSGEKNALHYYDLSRRTVTDAPMENYVVDAAFFGSAAVSVLHSGEGQALTYCYTDFSRITAESMDAAAYDKAVIEERRPLPEVSGVAAEILDKYGITVIGEHDFFDMAPYGYNVTPATAQQIADRTALLKDYLSFFPEGVFKELSNKAPVVIVLCDGLGGTAGGLNTLIDGYNVSFLSVGGHDDYFCGIASHELAHALERGIALDDLDGWANLQPEEVTAAYGNLSLTVEYTADDKGKTPVWFTDVYGRTNAMEDRATVFEEMHTAWLSGDSSTLNYDGLRKKVDFWSYMLRNNFTCCKDASFAWDSLFE